MTQNYVPRLKVLYADEVVSKLQEEFQFSNSMLTPRLTKIVVNVSTKDAVQNVKILDSVVDELADITGQKPAITRARRSIAGFKLREGMPLGARVTLRGARMWEFLDRLVSVALPRVRDFRGISRKGFDGRGNYSFGITEQIIFPEIDYDRVSKIMGMNISFVTTAANDEEGCALLGHLGVPFAKA